MENFGKILKELREDRKMSQAELGKALGYKSHSIIAQWESGRRYPSIENLIPIAKYFNVSLDELVGVGR